MQILPSLTFVSLVTLSQCGAFVPSSLHAGAKRRTAMSRSDDDAPFDIEAARQNLEGLVTVTGHPFREENDFGAEYWHSAIDIPDPPLSQPYDHAPARVELELPAPPPLTTLERARRLTEIDLLKGLADGDDALSDLWTLWFHERGPQAAARLRKIEELTGSPETWDEAERRLCALIHKFGVYWVEPISRLATLMVMQGRLSEAEKLFMVVLAVKPWHVGALSGIVMTHAGQKNNQEATKWAARRLPKVSKVSSSQRRKIWSIKAARAAQDALFDAEERLKDLYGAPDVHDAILRCRGIFVPENNDGCWQ